MCDISIRELSIVISIGASKDGWLMIQQILPFLMLQSDISIAELQMLQSQNKETRLNSWMTFFTIREAIFGNQFSKAQMSKDISLVLETFSRILRNSNTD